MASGRQSFRVGLVACRDISVLRWFIASRTGRRPGRLALNEGSGTPGSRTCMNGTSSSTKGKGKGFGTAPARLKPDHRYTRRALPWSAGELKRLGEEPDSVLARCLGRTIAEVVAMREERRIGLPQTRPWTGRELKVLGRYNDAEFSRRLSRKEGDGRQQPLLLP